MSFLSNEVKMAYIQELTIQHNAEIAVYLTLTIKVLLNDTYERQNYFSSELDYLAAF